MGRRCRCRHRSQCRPRRLPPTAAPTALLLQVVPELTGALKLMLQYRTT